MADRFAVVGQGTATTVTATVTSSPLRLVPGVNNVVVTTSADNQTFSVTMCSGSSASVASGTATVSGSPATCAQAAVTTITITNTITNGTLTITVTYDSTANYSSNYSWADATGGTPGATKPTTSSGWAYFDAKSFTATGQSITIDAAAACKGMDWTGALYSPTLIGTTSYNLDCRASITFISAMSTSGNFRIDWRPTAGTAAITTNGMQFTGILSLENVGTATFSFVDGYTSTSVSTGAINSLVGSIATNNNTINIPNGTFSATGTTARTLTLGSSIINCANWVYSGSNLTVAANTSTINCSGNFTGGGITTYNIVNLTGATSTITGSNTFTRLGLSEGVTDTITVTDGTTQTAADFRLSGSGGRVHTIKGSSTAGYTLAYTGGSPVDMQLVSISYATVTPTNHWYAKRSTNGGNNAGIQFWSPAPGAFKLLGIGG